MTTACGAPHTQPTVVVETHGATCDDATFGQDPYDAALARARCDHPDMLVHAAWYVMRRVPSGPGVWRFAVEQTQSHTSLCCYDVDGTGVVALHLISGTAP